MITPALPHLKGRVKYIYYGRKKEKLEAEQRLIQGGCGLGG